MRDLNTFQETISNAFGHVIIIEEQFMEFNSKYQVKEYCKTTETFEVFKIDAPGYFSSKAAKYCYIENQQQKDVPKALLNSIYFNNNCQK